MGGEVVGINTETFDANKDAIKEAASILESQGAKYRNLSIASDSAAGNMPPISWHSYHNLG